MWILILVLCSPTNGRSVEPFLDNEGGGHWDPPDPGDSMVEDLPVCSQCSPGYGVVTPCQWSDGKLTHDTDCKQCSSGSFRRGFTATESCHPCGACPENFYEHTPCQPFQDVTCKPCGSGQGGDDGFGNENFLVKCEKGLTNPLPKPGGGVIMSSPRIFQREEGKEGEEVGGEAETDGSGEGEDAGRIPGSGEGLAPTKHVFTTMAGIDGEEPERKEQLTTYNTTDDYNFTAGGYPEETGANVHQGAFQWPILLAALAAAIVFFVVGIVISQCVKRTDTSPKDKPAGTENERMVETRLMELPCNDYTTAPLATTDPDDLDATQPIIAEKASLDNGVLLRNPDKKKSREKRRSFYNSGEIQFMDEDSDDEIVRYTGRPPTVHYKDGPDRKTKKKTRRKPRKAWFERFRAKKPSTKSTGSLENVHRVGLDLNMSTGPDDEPDYGTV